MARAKKSQKPSPEASGDAEVPLPVDASLDHRANSHARFVHWSRSRPTSFEKKVYNFLGGDGNTWGFVPQQELFGFLVDFYAPEYNLVIEADGPDHIWSWEADAERDASLEAKGIRTLRLTPGDFVAHTEQELFDVIEELCKIENRAQGDKE